METWEEPSAKASQGLWLYTRDMWITRFCAHLQEPAPSTGTAPLSERKHRKVQSNLYNLLQRNRDVSFPLRRSHPTKDTRLWESRAPLHN